MARVEEKIKPHQKPDILLEAVMTKTPSEAEKVYRLLGTVDFTAYALGLACRFRGLETVKMLIENGAKFDYDVQKIKRAWRFDPGIKPGVNYAAAMLDYVGIVEMNGFDFLSKKYGLEILPINDRLAVIDHLCETAEKNGFDKDELLFYSCFSCNREITDHLKNKGAKIPEMWVKIIAECGWDDESKNKWFDYCFLVERLRDNDFIPGLSALVKELGGHKLHYTEWLWHVGFEYRQNITGIDKFFLEKYDLSKVSKTRIMKFFINKNSIEGLAAVAELGWLKQPQKRDEMIEYSAKKEKTECTAWLLDFKNRTSDLTAERERAEKKAERELNAAPDSVTALKQIWSYKKREDGSIIITGYKGSSTEISVPAKIGKSEVNAIGERAFSPYAPRLSKEARAFRQTIVKITLPNSVCGIGREAFRECKKLSFVNIPYGVTEICDNTFTDCGLENIEIPGSVKIIGVKAFLRCDSLEKIVIHEGVEQICRDAFAGCMNLKTVEFPRSLKIIENRQFAQIDPDNFTIIVPRDSAAEQICKTYEYKNINYIYKE